VYVSLSLLKTKKRKKKKKKYYSILLFSIIGVHVIYYIITSIAI